MAIQTKYFGGNGGKTFKVQSIKSLGMSTGWWVDALILNGKRYGGKDGNETTELEFHGDEYIKKVIIRSNGLVDFLQFITSTGREIHGGGSGGARRNVLNNVRVLGIGGQADKWLDKISIRYIENYQESDRIESGQLALIDIIPPGETR